MNQWLPHQDKQLREHFGKFSIFDLAKSLGKTSNAVSQRARKLGLIETEDKFVNQGRMHLPQDNPKSVEHIEFQNWLKTMPCQVPGCNRMAQEAHHAPFLSQGGTDDRQVGLCKPHHNENSKFTKGVHHMSRFDGNIMMGCDIERLAVDNWNRFEKWKAG